MSTGRKLEKLKDQLKNWEQSSNPTKQVSGFKKILKNLQDVSELNLIFDQLSPESIQKCMKNIITQEEKDQKLTGAILWFMGMYLEKHMLIEDVIFNYLLARLKTNELLINYLVSKALFLLCQQQAVLQEEFLKRVKADPSLINVGNQYYLQQLIPPNLPELLPANKEQFVVIGDAYARRGDILLGETLTPAVLSNIKYLHLKNPIITPQLPTKLGTRLIGEIFACLTPEENKAVSQWVEQGGFLFIEIDEIEKPVSQYLQQFGVTELRLSMSAFKPTYIWSMSEMVDPNLHKTEYYYQPPTIIFKTTAGDPLLMLSNGSDIKIWGKKTGTGYIIVGALVSALDSAVSYVLLRMKARNRLSEIIKQLKSELNSRKKIFLPDFANKNGIIPAELKTLIEENISSGQLLAYIQDWFLIAYEE